jgi:hypothetical protein
MKLGWELHSENNALWCRVVEGKYNRSIGSKSIRLITLEAFGESVA